MATHKVPQDVEAEDKLVGFLSLKQFIFTVIGIAFGYLTFLFFTKVHPLASLIWLPFTGVFLVLGLYQRKDQPVEVFLLSALRFYFKPHRRIWDQEGFEERVIITAPPKIEKHLTKDYSEQEVSSRLNNLSLLMDTRGWAAKQITQTPSFVNIASDRIVSSVPVQQSAAADPLISASREPDVQEGREAEKVQAQLNQATNETRRKAIAGLEQAREGIEPAQITSSVDSKPSTPATTKVNATTVNKGSKDKSSEQPVITTASDGSVEIKLH